ncbi:hypothetical protein EJ04DRAFT_446274 [Polyplosphaeria fusca]|uniref:Zn(2)-C6 fungal-type domain-containing protein n=1 Tax=Polyplosphaeria fusca TaxID=682080 RepID=A0A9P4QR61_9PLEO|nr:hypothetical protein EJ04DRAFT_446274 [Polyplosphaeria fusca]
MDLEDGNSALGRDQACNECRRRKARCDKVLPECGPCKRSRRHCLYERHSKTPLTRNAEDSAVPLEAPRLTPADFSWDEQSPGLSPEGEAMSKSQGEDEGRAVDGMASLTVHDNEAGYLGSASGAAMLRLLMPDSQPRARGRGSDLMTSPSTSLQLSRRWVDTPLWDELDIGAIDLDKAIDSYFRLYHLSYPLLHEPTFRAQYAQVIPRPGGRSWHALAFMIGAIGIFTTATGPTITDRDLFMAAKSNISIDSLESGNITLVQTLTLMSNYLQKRNKPNSGYNYLGLAMHMAMGLGLHKEFSDCEISPLNMEIRRRVWWCMFVFNIGAAITFGRPLAWPNKNVDVALPLNVTDRALTNLSHSLPPDADHVTTYTSVIMQSRFHLLTNEIYTRVITMPYPSATELLELDDRLTGSWEQSVPHWYRPTVEVPQPFTTGHAVMWWRLRNLRIIMYRPYVMRRALQARSELQASIPQQAQRAYDRCLDEAKDSIKAISEFWSTKSPTRLAAWYALYFLFQASLIPSFCLRNEPASPLASDFRDQIMATLHTMQSMTSVNPSAHECYQVLQRLCGPYLEHIGHDNASTPIPTAEFPAEESPQTQINNIYAMMWPSATHADADLLMQDGEWASFLPELDGSGGL